MNSLRLRGGEGEIKPLETRLRAVLTYSAVRPGKTRGTLAPVPVVSVHARATVVTKKRAKTT